MVLMMAMTVCAAFVACGDDDDNVADGVDSRIVGIWHSVGEELWEYKDDVLVTHWADLDENTQRDYEVENGVETGEYRDNPRHEEWWGELTVNADGTLSTFDSYGESEHATYKCADGVMTLTEDGSVVRLASYELKDGELLITTDNRNRKDDEGYSYLGITRYAKGAYPRK